MRVLHLSKRLAHTVAVFMACTFNVANALTISPDGPEQAPLIFVHGFIDDGTGWARNSLTQGEEMFSPLLIKYLRHYHIGPTRSPSKLFTDQGIENWAVQWWSRDGGNPFATADEGYAFLQTAEELLAGTDWVKGTWSAQNRPIPSAIDVLTSSEIDIATAVLPVPKSLFGVGTNVVAKVMLASQLLIQNNYQDAGLVDPRAEDFLELLRQERKPGGRLAHARQVNLITHSMGSLVARATLDKAFDASQQDSEFVANVIYNAPPFGGSTMAYLAKIYFEPAVIDSQIFNDERFALMLSTSATTHKDLIVNFIDLFMRPIGVEYADVEPFMPIFVKTTIDFLLLHPIDSVVDAAFIQNLAGTPEGDALAAAMQTIRPFVIGLTGVAGKPGYNDLIPEGGVDHLTQYTTNPDVAQFITLGTQGLGMHLFPNNLANVAADPTLIADNDELFAQTDDTAVPVGSAKLLTETDNFGPRMNLLGEFDLEHPDLLYRRTEVMASVWLETFLVPPTFLSVTGDLVAINSERRTYFSQTGDSTIEFQAYPRNRTIEFGLIPYLPLLLSEQSQEITMSADHHEYRIVSDDGTEILADWQTVAYNGSVILSDIVAAHSLGDAPFFFEWRSVNPNGGKELIRSARFVVAGDAPQVVDFAILGGQPGDVHQTARSAMTGERSVRTRTLAELSIDTSATVLATLATQPEASWVMSAPNNKALTMIFDQTATLTYQFNDATLSAPSVVENVNGHLIELANLSEGTHSLYYQLSKTVAGNTVTSNTQRLVFQIDTSAPFIAFDLTDNHPLGTVVGPHTPLSFTVQDVGVNGGSGELIVAGNSDWQFADNTVFTLNQTGLPEQMRDAGIDGGDTTLTLSARDFLNNTNEQTRTIFVDVTAPQLTLASITPTSIVSTDRYQSFADAIDIVIDVTDAGAGTTADAPKLAIADAQGDIQFTEPLTLGGVSGFPTQYGVSVPLSLGYNYIAISQADIAGNIGTLAFEVNRLEALSDLHPIESLTPRLDRAVCYNAAGNTKACPVGSIDRFVTSYDGETVAFESGGERFVEGDANGEKDIFVWQQGRLHIASTNQAGMQANEEATSPAISGNGRYVVFETDADNLHADAAGFNLYLKDLDTGRLAIISRGTDNQPINRNFSAEFKTSLTWTGRYIFFSSKSATYLSDFPNPGEQVYMVDVDPDGNGDFFDDNYVTHPISNINATTMPANASRNPKVTQDGRYVAYQSQTDGAIKLVKFTGTDAEGDLDTDTRAEVLLPNSNLFAISPYGDNVAFVTQSNLLPADTNTEFIDYDVYLSTGETAGGNFASRQLALKSTGYDGSASAMNAALPLQDVSVSLDAAAGNNDTKVAWVSSHTNIVNGDANAVEDLFVERNSATFPANLPVINWVSDSVQSSGTVYTGGLSPDGRYAYFVTQQKYNAPYAAADERHLFRRRIDEVSTHQLTVNIVGDGQVTLQPEGTQLGNGVYEFDDEPQIFLKAEANTGSLFGYWNNNASDSSPGFELTLNEDQTITATFIAAPTPDGASLSMTTLQNTPSEPALPTIVYLGDQSFTVKIVSEPTKGSVAVKNGNVIYKPHLNQTGTDSFEFDVINQYGLGLAQAATATVNITATNQPPTAATLIIQTEQDTASRATMPVVEDIDDTLFSFEVMQNPTRGVVTQETNGFIYTPISGFTGEDSFTFRAIDSEGQSVLSVALVEVIQPSAATTDEEPENEPEAEKPPKKQGGSLPIALFGLTGLLITLRKESSSKIPNKQRS